MKTLALLFALIGIGIISASIDNSRLPETPAYNSSDTTWEVQLNEMMYYIMRTSSINILYGLHFNKSQLEKLKMYYEKVNVIPFTVPDSKGKCIDEFKDIRNTYQQLLKKLENKEKITDDFVKQVYESRKKESEIIEFSIAGTKAKKYKGNGCYKCHAEPSAFPQCDFSELKFKPLNASEIKETNEAHLYGLFSKNYVIKLWYIRDEVDELLNNGQKCVMANFRCCLLPSDVLKDPSRFGQIVPAGTWAQYLEDIRQWDDSEWREYKHLYINPIAKSFRATFPGMSKKDIDKRVNRLEEIINDARKLDKIDFDIQKNELEEKIMQLYNIDDLTGESSRIENYRQLMTALYLLFPGNDVLIDKLLMDAVVE